jgi:hypothetical protein
MDIDADVELQDRTVPVSAPEIELAPAASGFPVPWGVVHTAIPVVEAAIVVAQMEPDLTQPEQHVGVIRIAAKPGLFQLLAPLEAQPCLLLQAKIPVG